MSARITRKQARELGIVWPPATAPRPVVLGPDGRPATKLELRFWDRLVIAQKAGIFRDVWREPFKLRVIADRWYTPDFVTVSITGGLVTAWEVKGYMREDAALKLLAAADRYRVFRWVLVQRDRVSWRCADVTAAGVSKFLWCPDWLK